MSGTVNGTLSQVSQADNALVKNAADKGGYTLVQAGAAGDMLIDLAAARMGGAAGRRFVGSSSTSNAFVNLGDANPVRALRKYWRFGAAPAVLAAIGRIHPLTATSTTAPSSNSALTYSLGTDRKLQLLEANSTGTQTLRGTSAVALPAATDLCTLALIHGATGDADAGKVVLRHYVRGSRDLITEQTVTLATPQTYQCWRMGIGTSNSLTQLDVNDMTAWGSGDWLDRPDLVDMVFDPPLDAGGQRRYVTSQRLVVTSGYTGPKTHLVKRGGAVWLPEQPSNEFVVPVGAVIDDTVVPVVRCAT